jgi:predicted dienelactone hydrolase
VTRRGKTAVTVCSTAFQTLGRAQARALGNAALPIAIIPHPFGGRSRDEVRRIAEQCAADIAKLLAGEAA